MTDGLDKNMAQLAEKAEEISSLEAELESTPEKTPQYEAIMSRLNVLYQQRRALEGSGQSTSRVLTAASLA